MTAATSSCGMKLAQVAGRALCTGTGPRLTPPLGRGRGGGDAGSLLPGVLLPESSACSLACMERHTYQKTSSVPPTTTKVQTGCTGVWVTFHENFSGCHGWCPHNHHNHHHNHHQASQLKRFRFFTCSHSCDPSGRCWMSNAMWAAAQEVPAAEESDSSVRCCGTNGWQSQWLWQRPSITRPARE